MMKAKEKSRSRIEINFIRLVGKCEELALNLDAGATSSYSDSNGDISINGDNWKLEKYTESLVQMLTEIRTGPNQPDRDTLTEYGKRVDFIKGIIRTSKLPTLGERVIASEQIKSGPPAQDLVDCGSDSSLTPSYSRSRPHSTMEIKHRHKTKYVEELRSELFGSDHDAGGSDTASKMEKPEDIDELLKFHKNMQEKIADHMLDLTRTLKEQVTLAGDIVKKDTGVLEKSGGILDTNQGVLKVESEKLETFNKRAWKCWTWFMLMIVCSTFIVMVLFMRLFRKRVTP